MQLSDELVPLLNTDNLSKIIVIDKDGKETTLSTRELASKNGFEWSDDIWHHSYEHPKENPTFKPNESALPSSVIIKVKNLASNPYVIKLKYMGKAGLGAISSKQIYKNDWLCFYAGELEQGYTTDRSTFAYSLSVFSSTTQNDKQAINATRKRNLANFIQDLPSRDELEKNYIFKPGTNLDQIATENVHIIYCTIYNCPAAIFAAKHDIPPNTLLGYSYGEEYWSGNIRRLLFDLHGNIIDEDLYISKKELEALSKQYQGKTIDYIYIAFKVAASKGDLATMRFFINWTQYIQDINHTNQQGKTALHYAASGKHTAIVDYLLTKGAVTNIADNAGDTPLHIAAINNDMTILALLINRGCSKQTLNKQQKLPIHYAIEHKNIDMLRILSVLCPYPNMQSALDEETREKFAQLMFQALSLQGRNEVFAEAKLRLKK